ncbi:MAG: MarR family transcriptional regulator, partial [Dactylosporangium sp.]|nr:MarR family transcriptional regulator [Dactylosporangium sp.]NNJ63392.1 MarR family transcriptional regulator [Dactylosporangium sp.]
MTETEDMIIHIMEAHRVMRERFSKEAPHPLVDLHLTMSQFKVVLILRYRGPLAGQDLAAAMGVSLATLTGIADRLVRQGLIARHEDPRDRRVRMLSLTEAGLALNDRLSAAEEAGLRRLLDRLDTDVLRIVARAYGLVAAAASAAGG